MTTVDLKPTNYSLVRGCPGVPKTYPTIQGIIELRTNESIPQLINSIKIQFITVDTLKFKSRDIPQSQPKINYEILKNFNDRILGMDIPFIIPIKSSIPTTNDSSRSLTKHFLKVELFVNKQLKSFEFPIVITTFDTLPLYRQFNEPITKTTDSKDRLVLLNYSIPSTSISSSEELLINLSISRNANEKKIKLKKLELSIVEIFECHCDKSFIKESVLNSEVRQLNITLEHEFSSRITLKPTCLQNLYDLFLKEQDPKLLTPSINTTKKNSLVPLMINHDSSNPIPFTHHSPMTFQSNLVSYRYELRCVLKYNHTGSVHFNQPFTLCPFDRVKSLKLLKWIMMESNLASEELSKYKEGELGYDSKYDVVKYPQPDPIIMKSKSDKDKFL